MIVDTINCFSWCVDYCNENKTCPNLVNQRALLVSSNEEKNSENKASAI